jgi:hypothetical protein
MISISRLVDIICTEALEYGGVQEVPDRSDGATESYHSQKRPARGGLENNLTGNDDRLPTVDYKLELIKVDGKLEWVK